MKECDACAMGDPENEPCQWLSGDMCICSTEERDGLKKEQEAQREENSGD